MNKTIDRLNVRLEFLFCQYFPIFAIVSLCLAMGLTLGVLILEVSKWVS